MQNDTHKVIEDNGQYHLQELKDGKWVTIASTTDGVTADEWLEDYQIDEGI